MLRARGVIGPASSVGRTRGSIDTLGLSSPGRAVRDLRGVADPFETLYEDGALSVVSN